MKIFLIFSYLIGTFTIIQAASYQPISQNIQQESEIAIEVSKKFQKGMLSKEQANAILVTTLSDYSHLDGKLATISQFIQNTTSINSPILNVSLEQRGWSGSEVYSIQTKDTQDIQFFLKIFPYESKYYLPEIFGLSLMEKVKEIGSPKICGCGQCIINEKRFFLVLETPVNGLSIQQYFTQVSLFRIGSEERKQALKELCEAVYTSGVSLARFHNHLPNKNQAFPKYVEETIRQDLKSAIEELIHQPKDGIEIEKLQSYTEYVLQKMKTSHHLVGLAYNDIKTIHAFYDIKTRTFSLVNPDHLCFSFDKNGEVCGLPSKDVCKYILSLNLNRFQYVLNENKNVSRKELLTKEEVKIVISSFELGYVQGGGILPTTTEKECFFLSHDLFFIKNSRRNLPEPELTRVKDLVDISLENIRLQLCE